MNVFARTEPTVSYPQFISVNDRNGECEITVRSPANGDACGAQAVATVAPWVALQLAAAIIRQYGTPMPSPPGRAPVTE